MLESGEYPYTVQRGEIGAVVGDERATIGRRSFEDLFVLRAAQVVVAGFGQGNCVNLPSSETLCDSMA